jgi:hypothetical protein
MGLSYSQEVTCGDGAGARCIDVSPLRVLRLQHIRTCHAEMRQRSRPAIPHDTSVVSIVQHRADGYFAGVSLPNSANDERAKWTDSSGVSAMTCPFNLSPRNRRCSSRL